MKARPPAEAARGTCAQAGATLDLRFGWLDPVSLVIREVSLCIAVRLSTPRTRRTGFAGLPRRSPLPARRPEPSGVLRARWLSGKRRRPDREGSADGGCGCLRDLPRSNVGEPVSSRDSPGMAVRVTTKPARATAKPTITTTSPVARFSMRAGIPASAAAPSPSEITASPRVRRPVGSALPIITSTG